MNCVQLQGNAVVPFHRLAALFLQTGLTYQSVFILCRRTDQVSLLWLWIWRLLKLCLEAIVIFLLGFFFKIIIKKKPTNKTKPKQLEDCCGRSAALVCEVHVISWVGIQVEYIHGVFFPSKLFWRNLNLKIKYCGEWVCLTIAWLVFFSLTYF